LGGEYPEGWQEIVDEIEAAHKKDVSVRDAEGRGHGHPERMVDLVRHATSSGDPEKSDNAGFDYPLALLE
jgi:hypothetical protein